jgi:MoaA/NifB/PqqE/SkfB family radical SAM enzyme
MTKVGSEPSKKPKGPMWVNAEITYKCPLHCVFCYNPMDYASTLKSELRNGVLQTDKSVYIIGSDIIVTLMSQTSI